MLASAALVVPACSGATPSPSPTETFSLPSSPRPNVVVPDLVGLPTVAADQALRQLGLYLVVDELVGGGVDDKTVARQAPAAGQEVPPASVVLVAARCLPAPCPSPPIDQFIYDPCTCAHR